ncbi:MAG: hypothetical protein WCO78_02010 [Candidatus Roizmanbacteria bacterium]
MVASELIHTQKLLPVYEAEPTPPQTIVIPYDFYSRRDPHQVWLSDIIARGIHEEFPCTTVVTLTEPTRLDDFARTSYTETACFIPPLEVKLETAERLIEEAVKDPSERLAMRQANWIAEYCHNGQIRRSDGRPYFTGHCTVAGTLSLIHANQSRQQGIEVSDRAIAMEYKVLVAHDAIEDSPKDLRAARIQLIKRLLGADTADQILVMTKDDGIGDKAVRNMMYVANLIASPRAIQRKMLDNQCNNTDDLIALLTNPDADLVKIGRSLRKSIEEYGPAFHDHWMRSDNPMNKQLYKQWRAVTQLAVHALEKRVMGQAAATQYMSSGTLFPS